MTIEVSLSFLWKITNQFLLSQKNSCDDPLLTKIRAIEKKWIILTDVTGDPRLALDSDAFVRSVLFEEADFNFLKFCHKPIIVRDPKTSLGEAIVQLKVYPERSGDDVIDQDIILFWGDEQRRIITGSDVLGRLLRGIVQQEDTAFRKIKYAET